MLRSLSLLLLLFQFGQSSALADPWRPKYSASDLQGKHSIPCRFHIAQITAEYIQPRNDLITPAATAWVDQWLRAAHFPEHTIKDHHFGLRLTAEFVNSMALGPRGDFARWPESALNSFLRSEGVDAEALTSFLIGHRMLADLGPGAIRWQPPQTSTGPEHELESLLAQVHLSQNSAQAILKGLEYVLKDPQDAIFSGTARRLQENRDVVVVCIAGKECSYINGVENAVAFHHTASPGYYWVSDLSALAKPTPTVLENGLPRRLEAIVVPYPELRQLATVSDWLGTYLHEMTHFTDMLLLSHWVWANQFLLNRQQPVDALFNDYVRIRFDPQSMEQFVIFQYGFVNAFLESRAYAAEAYVHRRVLRNGQNTAEVERRVQRARQAGVNQIIAQSGPNFMTKWGIYNNKPDDLFEMGLALERIMQGTITRATNLALTGK